MIFPGHCMMLVRRAEPCVYQQRLARIPLFVLFCWYGLIDRVLSPFLTGRMFVRRTYFGQFDEL